MKPFPEKSQLEYLLGLEVSSVVLHPYSIQLVFTDNSSINVEHCLEHVTTDGGHTVIDIQERYGAVRLHDIVQSSIVAVDRDPFELKLTFTNGDHIIIHSVAGPYESGQFLTSRDLIVF